MKFFHKIALLGLIVALVPLAALGFSLIRSQRDAVKTLLQERELALAAAGAERITRSIEELGNLVQATVRLVDIDALDAAERLALLRAVYGLSDDIVSVTWPAAAPRVTGPHSVVAAEQLVTLDAAIAKLQAAPMQQREVLMSPPMAFLGRKLPSVLWSMCVETSCQSRLFVELSLRGPQQKLDALVAGTPLSAALLVDSGDVTLEAGGKFGSRIDVNKLEAGKTARIADVEGELHLAAFVRVERTPFSLLVYQSEASAFALVSSMQTRTLLMLDLSALLSVALGYYASRALRRRLQEYERAAQAIGKGELTTRVVVDTSDELGVLGDTLNTMARDLQNSRTEIEAFNRELQDRVDARTAELRQAQARLVQAARAAAVGQLGAGVAHEIGNPLARIIGYAQLMKVDPALSDDTRESMDKIENAAHRVDAITKSLLRFSQTRAVAVEDVPLADVAEEAAELMRSQLEGAGIVLRLDVEPAVERGQRPQLVQALFQLLDNAKNATAKGGAITMVVRPHMLSVRDTGHGIAPEHLDRLFDPFFTTKKVWDSPGLGLSLVYRIAEEHGAQIKVESAVGQGTEVRILFSLHAAA